MSKTITRADLTEAVYREIGFSHTECADLVDSVLEEIIKGMEEEELVKLSSFGSFKVRHKKERVGRNPKTKVEVPISPRKVVSFHASNLMHKRINDALKANPPADDDL
jgi:integration host factor subunit alpha